MKKILALVVAFALCFTAVAGCITTSAEDAAAPAIEISSVELANTAGATSFTVSGTNCSTIAAQKLTVTIEAGVTFDGIVGLINAANVATGEDADYYVETVEGNTVVTLVSVLNIGAANDTFTYTFNVTVPANETEEAVVYDVTAATVAGSIDEEYINVEIAPATITVAAKAEEHVHVYGDLEYSVVDGVCYTKHTCECNEVETVAAVSNVPVTATAVVASSLALRFRIPMADVSAYSNIVGEFAKDTYDKDTYTGVSDIISITPTVNNNTRWQFEYAGIASYEMTAKIYINIYGTDANGYKVLVSRLEYAFVNYLADKYDSMNDKYKTLFADIAAYGTAAQRYMTYNISNPLPETFIPMDKVSELPTTFENATNVSEGIEIRPVPVVGNNIKMRYRVYKSLVADKDVNNLKITVDYIDASNKAQTFTVNGADFVTQGSSTKESWQIEFNDLVAAHLNDVLTIKLYDGDTVIGTLQYGFQTYAQNQYTSNPTSALATLCRAVVAYGKSTLAIY